MARKWIISIQLYFHHVLDADFIHLIQVMVYSQCAIIMIFAPQVIRICKWIYRILICAAYETPFWIIHERIFGLRNHPLPLITAVSSWHYEVALPFPFGGKFALGCDGNIPVLTGKNHILSGCIQLFDGLLIIRIIFRMIETVKKQEFISCIMCFPPYCIIFIICFFAT